MDFPIDCGAARFATMNTELLKIMEQTLEFTYHYGAVTEMSAPHTTGWRTLPYLVTAKTDSKGMLEVAGRGKFFGEGKESICIAPGIHHNCTLLAKRGISRWSCVTYTIWGGIDVFTMLETPLMLYGVAATRVAEINTELAELAQEPLPAMKQIARRKVLGFSLLEVVASASRWNAVNSIVHDPQRLLPVLTHIHQNIGKKIRVEDLARRAHLSVPRFHVVFRNGTGTSPQQYIVQLRIRKAQELLIRTDLSIADVAASVGQPDALFFSRIFKKKCGISPRQYRATTEQTFA